jgi:kynureninase
MQRLAEWELHGNGGWRVGKWMDIEDGVNEKLAAILNVGSQDVGFV